jgi:hypothetical protein
VAVVGVGRVGVRVALWGGGKARWGARAAVEVRCWGRSGGPVRGVQRVVVRRGRVRPCGGRCALRCAGGDGERREPSNALHSHEVLCRRLRFRVEGVGEKERSAISSASKSAAAASAPHARLAAICGHVQDNVSALKALWRGVMRVQATELSVEAQASVA